MKKIIKKKEISEKNWKDQLNSLQDLEDNFGWNIIENNIRVNLEVINEAILTKFGANDEKLDDHEVDLLRERRDIYLSLLDMPELLIQRLESTHETKEGASAFEIFDPYEKYKDKNMKTKT